MSEVNYYEILEVSDEATNTEIRDNFKKLVLKWHPDKCPQELRHLSEKKIREINEAYSVLSDPEKKRTYDMGGIGSMGMGDNIEDLFSQIFGANFFHFNNHHNHQKVPVMHIEHKVTLEQLYTGSKLKIPIDRLNIYDAP